MPLTLPARAEPMTMKATTTTTTMVVEVEVEVEVEGGCPPAKSAGTIETFNGARPLRPWSVAGNEVEVLMVAVAEEE